MSYAIIETGGKQLRVEPGRFYDIELLPVEPEATVIIDKVLLIANNGDVHIGQPLVTGATIEGTVMRHFRGRKVIVYKMRPKKKTRKKRGHRQEITRLMINSINLNGSALTSEQAAETTPLSDEPVAAIAAPEISVADEPDAQTIMPDAAQETVESVVADEPDAETAPENTAE
ncbi:MAG: 50S ribosomal protein L21 [Aphanothece sp. CMT-3BRIN-NPC111]|nr:50S ribosomal protein L21 [Aphanothece sp. CMT-3BRIN-NPC111]